MAKNVKYPFAALVGQPQMRRALILLAVDPGLGGALLRGEKGTAKSTAARGLADLLPRLAVVTGCPLGCDPAGPLCPACAAAPGPLAADTRPTPFVDLPVGATEDRVAGSLDLAAAVNQGRAALAPGLLARAHRGVLYIDEVNLLPPHLAALILDAAVSGINRVEREGISASHPSRFALIASYNPEEGPLSPQLLDRFGLCVEVRGEADPELRRQVLRRRLAFEADPGRFLAAWAGAQADLAQRLALARERLLEISLTPAAVAEAASRAQAAGARGQRAELALARAARALAAWRGLAEAGPDLVAEVAPLALAHRAMAPHESAPTPVIRLRRDAPPAAEAEEPPQVLALDPEQRQGGQEAGQAQERSLYILSPGAVTPVATRLPAREGTSARQAGRRAAREVADNRGRYLRPSAQRLGRSLALDATLRAAAPHQLERRRPGGPAVVVRPPDIREKVRAAKRGRLLYFCVDASGSMNAAARMQETKAAVLGLLTEAYQKRDRVGLVAFGGTSARELLPATASVEVARRLLAELPTGGKTPLSAGLAALAAALERELASDPRLEPLAVILTDGRPNVPLKSCDLMLPAGRKGGGWGDNWGDGGYADREVLNLAQAMARDRRIRYVVVDTDTGHHHEINLTRPLADYLGAPCLSLGRVRADQMLDLVKHHW